jgi:uncharacterized OsmC-like protein
MSAPATLDVQTRYRELVQRYTERPEAARLHKRARTGPSSGSDPFHTSVSPLNTNPDEQDYGVTLRTGADRAVGGLHDTPNPGELICAALAACFDGTARMIAAQLGVELERIEVEVNAEMDVRGMLAMDPSAKVGLQVMSLDAHLVAVEGTDPAVVKSIAKAAEKLCVNLDTLRSGVEIEVSLDTRVADAPS